MDESHADIGFFCACCDLVYRQIFSSLQALIQRSPLEVPVVGITRSVWGLDQLRPGARESLAHHGDLIEAAFDELSVNPRATAGAS